MLRQQAIIEDLKNERTPWISPIVVVPKNHGKTKIRSFIDMREADKAIDRTRYLSPSLKDLINILQGSKVYCKLDMKTWHQKYYKGKWAKSFEIYRTVWLLLMMQYSLQPLLMQCMIQ